MTESLPNQMPVRQTDPYDVGGDGYAFWLRADVDNLLEEFPATSVAALAASLERNPNAFDDGPERAGELAAELRLRMAADVRFWPPLPRNPLPSSSAVLEPLDGDDIPW